VSDEQPSNLFLIAARNPVPGETKTRLGQSIGMERAALLYRAFLIDLASHFAPTACYDVGWAYTPPEVDYASVLRGLGVPQGPRVRFVPQQGEGWGARQANLLRWGDQRGYRRTVLIASDSPHLPASIATDAFAALEDHDIVLGRVHDGGYYLIGARGPCDGVLDQVPMSTASAADTLAVRATSLGFRLTELPRTLDVDEAADLDRLEAELTPDGAAAAATWAALHDLSLTRALQHRHGRPGVDATGPITAPTSRD